MECAKHTVRLSMGEFSINLPQKMHQCYFVQLSIEAGGRISKEQAFAMASTNIVKLLGGQVNIPEMSDLVAIEGGDLLDMSGKVVAVISPCRNLIDLF